MKDGEAGKGGFHRHKADWLKAEGRTQSSGWKRKDSGRERWANGFMRNCCLQTKQTWVRGREPCVNTTVPCLEPQPTTWAHGSDTHSNVAAKNSRNPRHFLLDFPTSFTIKSKILQTYLTFPTHSFCVCMHLYMCVGSQVNIEATG